MGTYKKNNNVVKTERDLKLIFPENLWNKLHLQIIFMEENIAQRGAVAVLNAKYVQLAIQIEKNHLIDYYLYF